LEKPEISGRAYFLGQERPVSIWKFINDLASLGGVKGLPDTVIPKMLAVAAGSLFERFYRWLGRFDMDPPMTRLLALQLSTSHYFSHKAAENDLDYRPKWNIDEAFHDYKASLTTSPLWQ
jgi:nucleoside-diphosphate-sugar epimerase